MPEETTEKGVALKRPPHRHARLPVLGGHQHLCQSTVLTKQLQGSDVDTLRRTLVVVDLIQHRTEYQLLRRGEG